MKKRTLIAAVPMFLATLAIPTYAENTQVTVAGVVSAKSDSRSAIQKARPEALEIARRNAWLVLKKRSEFQQIVYNFEREQDDEMIARMSELCAQPVDLDQSYDKKLGQLTFRFRFQCNQRVMIRDASRFKSAGRREVRARLSGIFIALKDDRVEEFDATIKQSNQVTVGESRRLQASGSSSSDTKGRAAVSVSGSNNETTKESWTEGRGRVSEGLQETRDEKVDVKARVQTSSSEQVEFASDESRTRRLDTQTGGSKVRQSAKVTRVIVSAQEIQSGLVSILQRDQFGFVPYGTVSLRCNGLPFEQIQEELRTLPSDLPLALRDGTRNKVLQAVSSCQIPGGPTIAYYIEGYAKIGAPGVDPATGAVRVSVNVSQSIFDTITGEEISTTPEQQVYGVGGDETVATTNALKQAAELVGQTTVANLAGRGI